MLILVHEHGELGSIDDDVDAPCNGATSTMVSAVVTVGAPETVAGLLGDVAIVGRIELESAVCVDRYNLSAILSHAQFQSQICKEEMISI